MRFTIHLHVLVSALAGARVPTKSADISSDAPGRKLYVGKRPGCHKLYDPAKWSDEQWQVWMDKMGRKAKLQRRPPVKSATEASVFRTTNPRTSTTQGGTHDVLRRRTKP